MAPEPPTTNTTLPTTLTLNPSPTSTPAPTPSPDSDSDSDQDPNQDQDQLEDKEEKDTDKPSKPRPITSCAACRVRKVKCNRASPCSACISRKTVSECTYATTSAEREAIAQADLIAELRMTRNRMESQLGKVGAGSDSGGGGGMYGGGYEGGDGEEEALEAVYAVLRGGSVDLVREVVGRIRRGQGVESVLGWLEGGVGFGPGIGVGVGVGRN
ncbi:hypothetical protein BJX76DRAFT_355346 [Aspergillus varians]